MSINLLGSQVREITVSASPDLSGNVVCNGSNDEVEWQIAVDYLNDRGGGTVHIKAGDYTVEDSIELYDGIHIKGSGTEAVTVSYTDTTDTMFVTDTDRYAHSTIALTVNANRGDTSITVASAVSFSVDDWVKLSDDEAVLGLKKGEIIRIQGIAGNVITFYRQIIDDYTVANNAKIRELTFIEDITIEGMTAIGPGIENTSYFSSNTLHRNLNIRNVWLQDWGGGISTRDCLDVNIENCIFENIFLTGLGYSVVISNACDGIRIRNCVFREYGRHYIATGGSTGTYLSDGWFRNVLVEGCSFESSQFSPDEEAINTHSPSYGPIVIRGCTFLSCGKAIETQNAKSIIIGNKFKQCDTGIDVIGWNYYPNERWTIISDNVFESANIWVRDDTCYVKVDNNHLYDSYVYLNAGDYDCSITNNTFLGTNTPIYLDGASGNIVENIVISNNIINVTSIGIDLTDYVEDVSIIGNRFTNCAEGIEINANCSYIMIALNDFRNCVDDIDDNSGGGTIYYGRNVDRNGNWDEGVEP